jgi:hypothetical protein
LETQSVAAARPRDTAASSSMAAARSPVLTGAKPIAVALGASERTIRRRFHAGELTGAFQLAPARKSPIKITRSALAILKRIGG